MTSEEKQDLPNITTVKQKNPGRVEAGKQAKRQKIHEKIEQENKQ